MDWPLVGRDAILRRLSASLVKDGTRGIEIVGDVGVGKTRLAEELSRVATARGHAVLSAKASRSTSGVPFGFLSDHLSAPAAHDERTPADRLLSALQADPGLGPTILLIDDAHLVDSASADVLQRAATAANPLLLLTRRSGVPAPLVFTDLWKDRLLERIELNPLTEQATTQLVEAVLGGQVNPRTMSQLWRASLGHPLYLRELVTAGLESGALVHEAGGWRARHELVPSGRLVELVRAILGPMDTREASLVRALAVGEVMSVGDLEILGTPEALSDLEERGIVVIRGSGDDFQACLSHPIVGRVVAATMPRLARRSIIRWLADRLDATGPRRPDDLLKLVTWRIDAGQRVDSAKLIAATKHALTTRKALLAERLARAALVEGANATSAFILLAEALSAQERSDEALAILREASAGASTEEERGRIVLVQADLLYYRVGRPQDAAIALNEALGKLTEPRWRYEIEALLDLIAAKTSTRANFAGIDTPARSREVHTRMHSTLMNVMTGQLTMAQQQVREILEPGSKIAIDHPFAAEVLRINAVAAELYTGHVQLALEHALSGQQAAFETGAVESARMWAAVAAEAQAFAGDVEAGLRTTLDALSATSGFGFGATHGTDIARASMLLSWLGDQGRSRSMWQEAVALDFALDVRSQILLDRASVWLTWSEAGTRAAASEARAAGERASSESCYVWAALLYHDAVRLGHSDLVLDQLRDVTRRIDGSLFPIVARHAEGLAAGDAQELERVAADFETLGYALFAAESAAQARDLYLRTGRARAAKLVAARASVLATRCKGVRTPPFADLAAVPLTPRELDVVHLAVQGQQSKDIADQLGISVRTVDNHLASIYAKLGISSRRDLSTMSGADGVRLNVIGIGEDESLAVPATYGAVSSGAR